MSCSTRVEGEGSSEAGMPYTTMARWSKSSIGVDVSWDLACAPDGGTQASDRPSISDSADSKAVCGRRRLFFFFCLDQGLDTWQDLKAFRWHLAILLLGLAILHRRPRCWVEIRTKLFRRLEKRFKFVRCHLHRWPNLQPPPASPHEREGPAGWCSSLQYRNYHTPDQEECCGWIRLIKDVWKFLELTDLRLHFALLASLGMYHKF